MNTLPLLTRLQDAELLRGADAEGTFTFQHALVQDTAYTSLLKGERRRLHRLTGEALERAYGDASDGYAALLAEHFSRGGEPRKAFDYAVRAGDAAARVYAHAEASALYQLALEVGRAGEFDPDKLGEVYLKLGRVHEVANEHPLALARYDELAALAEARNDVPLRLKALLACATLFAVPTPLYDPVRGERVLAEALTLAETLNDGAAQSKIYWNRLLLYGFRADAAQAVVNGEKGIALARELGLTEQLAYLLNDIATYGYAMLGDLVRGRATQLEAREFWRARGNLPMLTDNLINGAIILTVCGDLPGAHRDLDEGIQVAATGNNLWGETLGHMVRGLVWFEQGEMSRALGELRPAYAQAKELGLPLLLIGGTTMAMVYAELGAYQEGLQVITEATELSHIPLYHVPSRATLGYLDWLNDAKEQAAAIARQLGESELNGLFLFPLPPLLLESELQLERDAVSKPGPLTAPIKQLAERTPLCAAIDAHWLSARAALARDECALAEKELALGLAEAEALGARRSVWKLYATAAQVAAQQGDIARAAEYGRQARQAVATLADASPPEYRAALWARARMLGVDL